MIDPPDADPRWRSAIRRALGAWYDREHRDLPWRRDCDPYRILVSETMLVQTTVKAVIPYYQRFLAQFPTVGDLAAADEADVLKTWEGLGYYRRARQLHAAAQVIVREHGGRVPESLDALKALPGVGRYIAGAVLSFAFDRPAPILEANTQRVLTRLLAWEEPPTTSASQARLWDAAERLVPSRQPGRFNQAIMELGATICTVRGPRCLICPIARVCQARVRGLQHTLPAKVACPKPLAVMEACVMVVQAGQLLIVRRGPGRLWEGFWEFPTMHIAGADPAGRSWDGEPGNLADGLARLTGIRAWIGDAAHTIRFGVTKHRVELAAHPGRWLDGEPCPGPGLSEARWIPTDHLGQLSFGSAQRRLATWATRTLERNDWPSSLR